MSEEGGLQIKLCKQEFLFFQIEYTKAWKVSFIIITTLRSLEESLINRKHSSKSMREMDLAREDRPSFGPIWTVEIDMLVILLTG